MTKVAGLWVIFFVLQKRIIIAEIVMEGYSQTTFIKSWNLSDGLTELDSLTINSTEIFSYVKSQDKRK